MAAKVLNCIIKVYSAFNGDTPNLTFRNVKWQISSQVKHLGHKINDLGQDFFSYPLFSFAYVYLKEEKKPNSSLNCGTF